MKEYFEFNFDDATINRMVDSAYKAIEARLYNAHLTGERYDLETIRVEEAKKVVIAEADRQIEESML